MMTPAVIFLGLGLLTAPLVVADAGEFTYRTNGTAITITGYIGTGSVVNIPDAINNLPVTRVVYLGNTLTHTFNGSQFTDIVLPRTLTNIGACAFEGFGNITNMALPDTVTDIGDGAFLGCGQLSSISIPRSVRTIDRGTFMFCESLTNLTLSEGITSIGAEAFSHCTFLPRVKIPASVTNIDPSAFELCRNLKTIQIQASNGVYSSVNGSLYNKEQTTLLMCPSGTTGIFTIAASITNIPWYAFYPIYGCCKLTAINVDPANAFYSSVDGVLYNRSRTELICCPGGIKGSITLPPEVTQVAGFSECANLTNIGVDAANVVYSSVDGVLFNIDRTVLMRVPRGRTGHYSIPTGVTTIGHQAFYGCVLTSIDIPVGVTVIGNMAFSECPWLAELTIPPSVTTISFRAISHCERLTRVTVAGRVVTVDQYGFASCRSLTNVTFAAGVMLFGDRPFEYCPRLVGVYFQGNAPSATSDAFVGCTNTVYHLPNTTGWSNSFGGRPTAIWNPETNATASGQSK